MLLEAPVATRWLIGEYLAQVKVVHALLHRCGKGLSGLHLAWGRIERRKPVWTLTKAGEGHVLGATFRDFTELITTRVEPEEIASTPRRGELAPSPASESGTCSHWGSARGNPGVRVQPPRMVPPE